MPVLGGDSSPSPLPRGELASQVEHTQTEHNLGLGSHLQEIRLKIVIMGPPVAAAMSFIIQGLSDGEGTDAVASSALTVHQCHEFIPLLQVLLSTALPVKWVRQGSSFPKGTAVSYTSKLQPQRKYPILMWFKKVAGRGVETL